MKKKMMLKKKLIDELTNVKMNLTHQNIKVAKLENELNNKNKDIKKLENDINSLITEKK